MFRTVGRDELCCVVAIFAPVSRLPIIHFLPSLVLQCRQADLFRQIFRSGAADDTHDFVMDPESHRLHWLAKCINIAIRDSGMRGEGQ